MTYKQYMNIQINYDGLFTREYKHFEGKLGDVLDIDGYLAIVVKVKFYRHYDGGRFIIRLQLV